MQAAESIDEMEREAKRLYKRNELFGSKCYSTRIWASLCTKIGQILFSLLSSRTQKSSQGEAEGTVPSDVLINENLSCSQPTILFEEPSICIIMWLKLKPKRITQSQGEAKSILLISQIIYFKVCVCVCVYVYLISVSGLRVIYLIWPLSLWLYSQIPVLNLWCCHFQLAIFSELNCHITNSFACLTIPYIYLPNNE